MFLDGKAPPETKFHERKGCMQGPNEKTSQLFWIYPEEKKERGINLRLILLHLLVQQETQNETTN